MGQTLTHGIYLPNEGERNCYDGLAGNWQLLDGAVGTIAEHTSQIAGKAPLVHTHTKSDITDLFNSTNTWTSPNTYNGMVLLKSSSDVAEQFKQKLPKDVSVSTDALVRFNTLTDSKDHNVIVEALGHWTTYVSKSTSLKYKNDSTKQGTIDFRLESSGSGLFYPQSPFECHLGNSSNQWKSVYAQSYYYNGVAWGLDKANTWSAENTYTNTLLTLKHTALEMGVLPTSYQTKRYRFTDKNNADLGWLQHRVTPSGDSYLEIYSINKFSNGQLSPQGGDVANALIIGIHSDGKRYAQVMSDFFPVYTNFNCNLGTSTNKWKSFNGINPGALSLPDCQVTQSIDRTGWVYDGATYNTVLLATTDTNMTKNGWLYVRMTSTTSSDKLTIKYNSTADRYPTNTFVGTAGFIEAFVPVVADTNIYLVATKDLSFCKFYPCLGNVPSGV